MMPAKNHQIDLPQIPSLPPIQMPGASDLPSTSSLPPRRAKASLVPPTSSPFASQDTFQTARSSPSHSPDQHGAHTPIDEDLLLPPSPHSLLASSALRKSISVDSFMKSTLPPSQATRSTRVHTMSSNADPPQEVRQRVTNFSVPSEPTPSSSRVPLRERDKRSMPPPPTPSRSRGTSISTNTDDYENASFFDESDMERSEDLSRRARRSKTTSRHLAPAPGELGLPSRLQPMSSFPNITAGQVPAPIVPVRSSSLSHKLAKSKTHVSIDTHIPPPSQPPQVTIAVVGAVGCGKSSVIRKGLKAYGLSEPVVAHVPPHTSSFDSVKASTYTIQTGKVGVDPTAPQSVLRVLEIECSILPPHGAEKWEQFSLDGAVICYDAAREESFPHVADRLQEFSSLKLPTVVLACKSDLDKRVDPQHALHVIGQYDAGLVEVTANDPFGKDKMRTAFEWIFKVIFKVIGNEPPPGSARSDRDGYRNPASPAVLGSTPPWDISRASSATPTAASTNLSHSQIAHSPNPSQVLTLNQSAMYTPPQSPPQSQAGTPMPAQTFRLPSPTSAASSRTPTTPTSPTRARSTSDLLSEHEKSRREEREQYSVGRNVGLVSPNVRSRGSLNALSNTGESGEGMGALDESQETSRDMSVRESRAPPWMTLEELLNKLLFMAVSDDDPLFISHFLLTYRRFASPRSILLAMQKRMRALDQPSGDPMFACYAQMRICLLLDNWIHAYPTDFAVPGAAGALAALIKSILTKTYLLHYGADFLPFLDFVPNLRDRDQAWALKVDEESDDSSVLSDEEGYSTLETASSASSRASRLQRASTENGGSTLQAQPHVTTRDRKSSLPLTAKALVMGTNIFPPATSSDTGDHLPKQTLKRLVALSEEVLRAPYKDIAFEITRIEAKFFLQIKPRHWLQHVLVQGRKDPETDPIAKYNHISNHIADWVVSLILCHDKAKARTRQIEKFVLVAEELRVVHNYSALRAVIAGINSATFDGDESLELFRSRSQELWKKFQSYDQLLQSVRSHQKYRMALRNTKGACIPALEIHLSDLIRAHEGNTDYHDDDPTKIHWAKFNMMAKFIDVISQCQDGCRTTQEAAYKRPDRYVPPAYLCLERADQLMDIEMQRSRIAPPDSQRTEDGLAPLPHTYSRDGQHHPKDAALLRRILFW